MASNPSTLVATLVANPERIPLSDAIVDKAMRPFGGTKQRVVLAKDIASDLYLDQPLTSTQAQISLREALGDLPIDVIVQPPDRRRKRLFLADMDSTMIGQECIDELADYVGLRAQVSAITERAMRGEIAFEPALTQRVALLRNLPVNIVDEILTKRITLTPGGQSLVRTMRAHGAYTCLVSGGFTLFTQAIAKAIGFDEHNANLLSVSEGRLTGTVARPILGREAKRERLLLLQEKLGLKPWETLAVGDGANDLAMLAQAGLGIAYRAKPAVAEAAHARIDHTDLRTLLYCQGYCEHEFVE